jgi:hypothetical protein
LFFRKRVIFFKNQALSKPVILRQSAAKRRKIIQNSEYTRSGVRSVSCEPTRINKNRRYFCKQIHHPTPIPQSA